MADLGILASYAHPDDEQGVTGTLARAARAGIRTGLICATRGELGEIADPALATPDNLGTVREAEMRCAVETVGIQHLWFLDYRDSGMAGTAGNADPRAFNNADGEEATRRIVQIMREFRPQVVLTFEPNGGYGHPDHIAISRWTTAAFHAAGQADAFPEAGPPWAPARLFYAAIPRSGMRRFVEFLREHQPDSAFAQIDPEQMGMPDEEITNTVDVSDLADLKAAALACHATQLPPDSPFARLPDEVQRAWRSQEFFALVAGTPMPPGADPSDLFAGLPAS